MCPTGVVGLVISSFSGLERLVDEDAGEMRWRTKYGCDLSAGCGASGTGTGASERPANDAIFLNNGRRIFLLVGAEGFSVDVEDDALGVLARFAGVASSVPEDSR